MDNRKPGRVVANIDKCVGHAALSDPGHTKDEPDIQCEL